MFIYEQVNSDLKEAMKAKEEFRLSVLRMFLSALKNKKIDIIGSGEGDLTDEQSIAILQTEIKKRKDSIALYEQGNRPELADKEKKEIAILEKYLPAQAGEAEIEAIVKEIIAGSGEVSQKDFGRIMGQAMGKLKGKADGNAVGEAVKKLLG